MRILLVSSHVLAALSGMLWSLQPVIAATSSLSDSNASDTVRQLEPLSNSAYLVQMSIALLAVLGLILGLAWFARRVMRGPVFQSSRFTVLGTLALGPREKVMLVKIGDQQVLLGITPGNVHSLQVLEHHIDTSVPDAPATRSSDATGFASHLRRALGAPQS